MRTCEVVRCRDCGLLRTHPEPQPEAIYQAETSKKYTVDRSAEHFAVWETYADQMVNLIEQHVPRGRLLDIGCDQAIALQEARRRGWNVEGVEINSAVAQAAMDRTGIVIHDRPVEQLVLPEGSFDAIICNQVIEHVPDPLALIAEIRRLLRPDGVAFIGTPCFTAPIGILFKRHKWYALLPSEHFWQFGPRSLRRLIQKTGLTVVHYHRGCSHFWDEHPRGLRSMVRSLLFRTVALTRQGDFLNYVVQR